MSELIVPDAILRYETFTGCWGVSKVRTTHSFRISTTHDLSIVYCRPHRFLLLITQLHLTTIQILNQSVLPGCSRNREDVVALGQKPSQCQLRGRDSLGLGNFLYLVHKGQVLGKVLLGEPGQKCAKVSRAKVGRRTQCSAQEAAAEWRVCDNSDA
ncbi:hypothetical protein HG531_013583 [Fusarium graminearum]|nr:hypothetical protein HG531_013583 [Fusarium graminearum]